MQQMVAKGFTKKERDIVSAAFLGDLSDADYGERAGVFFGQQPRPGITEGELTDTMAQLRSPDSIVSKGLRMPLHKDRLNDLEEILHAALIGNKEHLF